MKNKTINKLNVILLIIFLFLSINNLYGIESEKFREEGIFSDGFLYGFIKSSEDAQHIIEYIRSENYDTLSVEFTKKMFKIYIHKGGCQYYGVTRNESYDEKLKRFRSFLNYNKNLHKLHIARAFDDFFRSDYEYLTKTEKESCFKKFLNPM